MDASLRKFQQQGLTTATKVWDHRVSLSGVLQVFVNGNQIPYVRTTSNQDYYQNTIAIDPANPDWRITVILDASGNLVYLGNENEDASHGVYTGSIPPDTAPDGFILNVGNWLLDDPGDVPSVDLDLRRVVDNLTLIGVQTDVEVDPEQLKEFGFNVKRVFSLLVNDPAIIHSIKIGMTGTDSNGEPCRFIHYKRDFLGVHLYFGSVNR